MADVDDTTMEWTDWINNRRLHSQLEYVPPEEYEAAYYAHTQAGQPATPQPCSRHQTPRRFSAEKNADEF